MPHRCGPFTVAAAGPLSVWQRPRRLTCRHWQNITLQPPEQHAVASLVEQMPAPVFPQHVKPTHAMNSPPAQSLSRWQGPPTITLQVLSPPSQPTSKPAIGQHEGPMQASLSFPQVDVDVTTGANHEKCSTCVLRTPFAIVAPVTAAQTSSSADAPYSVGVPDAGAVYGTLIVTSESNGCPCGVNAKTLPISVTFPGRGGASDATPTVIGIGVASAPAGTTALAPPADTVPPAGPIVLVDEKAPELSAGASPAAPSCGDCDAGEEEHAAAARQTEANQPQRRNMSPSYQFRS